MKSVSQKDKYHYDLTYMWNLENKKAPRSQIQRTDWQWPEADDRVGKMGEGTQNV